jgi:hypothetical protein
MIAALMGVPGKLKTLLDRLTSARAGYLDNLSAGAVAQAGTALSNGVWTNALATELDGLAPSIAAIPTTPINRIQAVSIVLSGVSSNTATITAVTTAKAFVVMTGFSCDASAAGAGMHHVMSKLALTDTTTVTASRASNTGTVSVNGFVIEFK